MTQEHIDLKQLERSGLTALQLDERYHYTDLPLTSPVSVQANIRLDAVGVNIEGAFETNIEEPCDRCSEPFQRRIEEIYNERFVFEDLTDHTQSKELQLGHDDFFDTVDPEEGLDLKDLIYQLIVMAISQDRFCNSSTCHVNQHIG